LIIADALVGFVPAKEINLMKRILIPVIFVGAITALVIALTSSGTSKASKSGQARLTPYGGTQVKQSPPTAGATVDVRNTPLGRILVDSKGRTLYLFEADQPNASNCSAACLSVWPALTTNAKPQANGGAVAAKLGSITTNGQQQVTYNGHPLYYYAGDQMPGDTTGQGLDQFGAGWDVLDPAGNKIESQNG
jgi:predicted lipoprotein with Yx(FWY)xxD motif